MHQPKGETFHLAKQTPASLIKELRKEIAKEEALLSKIECDIQSHSADLGRLRAEYASNVSNIVNYYETQLEPFKGVVYEANEKQSLTEMQIDWLEKKIIQQEKSMRVGQFLEVQDMRPAAEELLKQARQKIVESYKAIQECPEKDLLILSNYECPHEQSIETMQMVLYLRGEEDCSWKASQVYLTATYFKSFFVARSESFLKKYDFLPEDRMLALEEFFKKPSHEVKGLYVLSTPIGCLGQWLRAVRDHYRVKLVTAPVLLADTSLENTKKIQDFLKRYTFGENKQMPEFKLEEELDPVTPPHTPEVESSTKSAQSPADELADSKAQERVDKEKLQNSIVEQMVKNVVDSYNESKKKVANFSQPAEVTHMALRRLRHYLNWLKENSRDARESMEVIQREATGKLTELAKKYDHIMIPIEKEMRNKVDQFSKVYRGEALEGSCKSMKV